MDSGEADEDEPAYVVEPDGDGFRVIGPADLTAVFCADEANAAEYAALLESAFRSGYRAGYRAARRKK